MNMDFLLNVNYFAVALSACLFFVWGVAWFSALFGQWWVEELKDHNVIIEEPTSNTLMIKMLLNFLTNIIISYAMACLVSLTGSSTVYTGLILGCLVAGGFAATTLATVFNWENRSLKLFLLDAGYPVIGIIAIAILLSVWR